jgi:hypothetical protein
MSRDEWIERIMFALESNSRHFKVFTNNCFFLRAS